MWGYTVCAIYNKKALLNVQKPDYSKQDYMHLYLRASESLRGRGKVKVCVTEAVHHGCRVESKT